MKAKRKGSARTRCRSYLLVGLSEPQRVSVVLVTPDRLNQLAKSEREGQDEDEMVSRMFLPVLVSSERRPAVGVT